VVDGAQGAQHLHALGRGHQGPPGALEALDRGIAVDADEQDVTERARSLEIANVTDVQEIETAVGQDDALAVRPQPLG
jgi:hypothetical protein